MLATLPFVAAWAQWYGDSTVLSSSVTAFHLGGMLLGGGLAVASDRAMLRALRRPEPLGAHLADLESAHRLVALGLVVTIATGLLMLAADIEALLGSPVFWIKMLVLGLLLTNGRTLRRTARRLDTGPADSVLWRARLRRAAFTSAALWFAALALGAALPSA